MFQVRLSVRVYLDEFYLFLCYLLGFSKTEDFYKMESGCSDLEKIVKNYEIYFVFVLSVRVSAR